VICLTGDVHHRSFNNEDRKYLKISEVEAAIEYAKIAAKYKTKVTLFLTGKAVKEEQESVRQLLRLPSVELGGHNYYAFRPRWLYNGIFVRGLGLTNGPAYYQNYEIKKTMATFKRLLGVDIVSWRDHAYRHDRNTYSLLARNGIRFVSDEVMPGRQGPYICDGLTIVPINVMPDHDHIYHGKITPETAQSWALNRDKFPPNLYSIEEWLEIVKNQIADIFDKNGVATILAHPACMKIADDFKVFASLCRFISKYDSVLMRELSKAKGSKT